MDEERPRQDKLDAAVALSKRIASAGPPERTAASRKDQIAFADL